MERLNEALTANTPSCDLVVAQLGEHLPQVAQNFALKRRVVHTCICAGTCDVFWQIHQMIAANVLGVKQMGGFDHASEGEALIGDIQRVVWAERAAQY